MKTLIKIVTMVFLAGIIFVSCEEDLTNPGDYQIILDPSKTPAVTTAEPVKVSSGYAILQGEVVDVADDRGFLISETDDFEAFTVVPSDTPDSILVFSGRPTLTQQTTYYYRAYSTTALGGTKLGEISSFTTREGFTAFEISAANSSVSEWEAAGFTTIDKDGDGQSWELMQYQDSTKRAYVSFSWRGGSALTPENYLVFPEIDFDGVDGELTVQFQALDPDWFAEKFKVVVSDAPITEENCRDAEVIFEHTLANADIFSRSIDVPAKYEGGKVYFAIAHYDVTDFYAIYFLGAKFSYAK